MIKKNLEKVERDRMDVRKEKGKGRENKGDLCKRWGGERKENDDGNVIKDFEGGEKEEREFKRFNGRCEWENLWE